ncbi:DUF484 family protein [Pseudomarimonas salicorniae]|uniref:DUF484 family protein n=1 Tax=Pseudomarimonas salicorniae TaxID=2933270 RepID=A0ABT0GF80_9GAMM|nr:DUF484 family protein [Lysobacter sp. CAU 1642]MCK7592829.1 DUF484 family protein [Lysobacter sp. CAU 1642]
MSDIDREGPSPHEVASYLRRNPRFLAQFPDLALGLVVPRDSGPATSLASYQLEVLRDKNRELNRRLQELFANAQDNERLAVRVHQQALLLMRQRSATDTLRALAANLAEDFAGELFQVLLFERPADLEDDAPWLRVISRGNPRLAPFEEFLAAGEPLCGRIDPDKLEVLFDARTVEVQSVALLPLNGRGMLAVGSHDANRFFPGMGTLFLRMMADSLEAALARFDEASPER